MRQALDASLAFTDALGKVQTLILDRLEEINLGLMNERRKITEREEEVITLVRDKAEFNRMVLSQIMDEVTALRAIVADGSDDMAQAMAKLLGPRVSIAPADEETIALAQRLAPPMRDAAE